MMCRPSLAPARTLRSLGGQPASPSLTRSITPGNGSLHDRFWNEEGRAAFAFCDAPTGELFGSIALGEVDLVSLSGVVGYWAAPWARNRGATTRALKLVCGWGFEALGIETVELMTLPGNVASDRVAAKAGFELVGTLHDYKPTRAVDPDARHRVKHWILHAEEWPPHAVAT